MSVATAMPISFLIQVAFAKGGVVVAAIAACIAPGVVLLARRGRPGVGKGKPASAPACHNGLLL